MIKVRVTSYDFVTRLCELRLYEQRLCELRLCKESYRKFGVVARRRLGGGETLTRRKFHSLSRQIRRKSANNRDRIHILPDTAAASFKTGTRVHGNSSSDWSNEAASFETGTTPVRIATLLPRRFRSNSRLSRQDRTGQDRTGQDGTGRDRTGQDRTGQDRTMHLFHE